MIFGQATTTTGTRTPFNRPNGATPGAGARLPKTMFPSNLLPFASMRPTRMGFKAGLPNMIDPQMRPGQAPPAPPPAPVSAQTAPGGTNGFGNYPIVPGASRVIMRSGWLPLWQTTPNAIAAGVLNVGTYMQAQHPAAYPGSGLSVGGYPSRSY